MTYKFKTASTCLALIVAFVSNASAAPKTGCTVLRVGYDVGRMAMQCVGDANVYYAFNPDSGSACPKVSQTTANFFMSLTQSALLSGKQVSMDYTDNNIANCTGVRTINYINLQ